jgi:hypothetical protein
MRISVSERDLSELSLLSGFRESLPNIMMFIAPEATFGGRPPVIWENGSVRLTWPSRLLA